MRTEGIVAALVVLAALAGCIAPADQGTVEAASIEPTPSPGLLQAPRLVDVPAGDSYTVLWLNATEADWVKLDGRDWLLRGFEFPEDAEMAAYGVVWLLVDGGKVAVTGTHLGSGGGAGGSGRSDEPRNVTSLAIQHVVDAASEFQVRFGAQEKMMDFELDGEGIPAEIVDQGEGAGFAWYFEFASPFSAVYGAKPHMMGFEAEDTRTPLPGGIAGAAGALTLAFDHPVEGPNVHVFSGIASSFQGERVGQWSFEHTTDGKTFADGGLLLAEPFMPWAIVRAAPRESVSGTYVLDVLAEVMPITLVHAITTPFDAAALGLTVETESLVYGGTPVVVLDGACLDLARDVAPSPAACRSTEA